ncbi:PLD nuclease N-terminal domain-containing protein [Candidatus Auribacterota bacterium]
MKTLLGLAILVLDIVAIVDAVRGKLSTGKKVLWIILILILPVVGMILYFLLGRQK